MHPVCACNGENKALKRVKKKKITHPDSLSWMLNITLRIVYLGLSPSEARLQGDMVVLCNH